MVHIHDRPSLPAPRPVAPARLGRLAGLGAILLAAACSGADTSGAGDDFGGGSTDRRPTAADTLTPTIGSGTSDQAQVAAATGGAAVSDGLCVGEGPLVEGRRVGAVRLGMTADELRRTCHTADTTFTLGEGIRERGLATRVAGAGVVALLGPGDTVERVLVREAGLVTAKGIGVTSNVAAVRARHPGMCALVGEGRIHVAAPDEPGVSFDVDVDFGRYAGAARGWNASALPDSAVVTGIWVHGVERPCAR